MRTKNIILIALLALLVGMTSCKKDYDIPTGTVFNFNAESIGGSINGYDYVDLGLPSGLLWATCNVGANDQLDYGNYYAWGETQPKTTYNWSTYKYCQGSENTLTKYCNNSTNGFNGFADNLTTLLPEDDAAAVNWGNDWRMPTHEEWQELYQNTTQTWITLNGVNGHLITASNGNKIFLPAAGDYGENIDNVSNYGEYWSSSLRTDYADCALGLGFSWSDYQLVNCYDYRYFGASVRAVYSVSGGQPSQPLEGRAIEWVRKGANVLNAEEMDSYGLQWTSTYKSPFATIKPIDGAKLYVCSGDDFEGIVTGADKAAYFADLVETATTAESYRKIDVSASADYNDMLAVVYEGATHLIHITRAEIETGSYGTQITIKGEAK